MFICMVLAALLTMSDDHEGDFSNMEANWHCYIAVPYPFPRMVPTSCQGLEWQEMGMGMMMGVSQ